jgi:chromosome segregation ATPase
MSKPGRQGLSESQIQEAISQLQDEGQNPTPATIRGILGSGSYSTIGTVLSKWREEQKEAATSDVPDMPSALMRMSRQLWLAAWKGAKETHTTERAGFEAERSDWHREKSEMSSEIERLEESLAKSQQALEEAELTAQRSADEANKAENQLDVANGRIEILEVELAHMREDRNRQEQSLIQLTERAVKAESRVSVHF